jgi:hypothetical protein
MSSKAAAVSAFFDDAAGWLLDRAGDGTAAFIPKLPTAACVREREVLGPVRVIALSDTAGTAAVARIVWAY